MNRIQLKNIKYAAFSSEETHCYEASVYFDGKKVGTVSNDGHGGSDYEYPTDKAAWAKMEDYILSLPSEDVELGNGTTYNLLPSLEVICGDLVNDWLTAKDLKRALSKKVLFQKKGNDAVFETKAARNKATLNHWINQVAERDDTSEVLNLLPIEKALEIYTTI
jgi:hypothetical protein